MCVKFMCWNILNTLTRFFFTVSGHTQLTEGTQVTDPPLCFETRFSDMSKVLGEKIGFGSAEILKNVVG